MSACGVLASIFVCNINNDKPATLRGWYILLCRRCANARHQLMIEWHPHVIIIIRIHVLYQWTSREFRKLICEKQKVKRFKKWWIFWYLCTCARTRIQIRGPLKYSYTYPLRYVRRIKTVNMTEICFFLLWITKTRIKKKYVNYIFMF